MAEQYWIGGFYIDLSRNQISQNQQSQTLAPKALAVLTCLAENQGKVVSQDELLDKVWQGTIVSPNTLQRSIAQLRKALGDEGKVYIKTHAKQGYSLECDVRWQAQQQDLAAEPQVHETPTNQEEKTAAVKQAHVAKNTWLTASLFAAVVLVFLGYLITKPAPQTRFSFTELRAVTATEQKEFGGVYSPDGKYLVFNRYTDLICQNNIWAKDLTTQQEFKLSEQIGTYSGLSFSKQGDKLVLIQQQDCTQPITQKQCYKLMQLDFNKALNSPQPLTELMECKNSAIRDPAWLNNNNIALMQKRDNRWKLISYSIDDNKSQTLHEVSSGNLIRYDYSTTEDLIALTSVDANEDYFINIVTPTGKLQSSHKIQYPKEIAKFRAISANFSPLAKQLVFSTGRQLFTLSRQGEVSNISLLLDEPMSTPIFHPNGNRMVVVKGHYDADVVSIPLSSGVTSTTEPYTTIARSNAGEYNAMKQPNGTLVVFKSKRSGEEQVWITDGHSPKQLSQFPMDTFIWGMDWHESGDSLLVNTDYSLTQVFLDGRIQKFTLPMPVIRLFQWHNQENKALGLIRKNGIAQLAEINLTTLDVTTIANKAVTWAVKTNQGNIIYTDGLDRFWQTGSIEDQLIEPLTNQGSDKRFIIKNNTLYGVNDNFQIWSYSLTNKQVTIIGKAPQNLDQITDIDKTDVYGVVRVSAKKELAEVFLEE